MRFPALVIAAFLVPFSVRAEEVLPSPTGPVVLVITGNIETMNAPGQARFDKAMLVQLGQATITTHSTWWDGAKAVEGVPLRAVLERVKAKGQQLQASALNDYQVNIPISDLKYDPIIAMSLDGKSLSLRDRGPLWIVYPLDRFPEELKNEVMDARSIWQLKKLNVD
ncbi:molybdopterin-dependent oxidoreductase [Microvirga sp. 2MCAF38]|uniref:molybdopterin-dependent oxidoreductase n=1 Tax=Microvirga sp. 2MCAF38 TaxID=3232989 RepID=UPI003F945AA3